MIPSRNKHGRPVSQLCLGAAQLGMPYGIANRAGQPDMTQTGHMLSQAKAAGITLVDTARAYGESEQRIGDLRSAHHLDGLTIMTKLSPLESEVKSGNVLQLEQRIIESVQQSCALLRLKCLPYLQLHRASHLQDCDGMIWKTLQALREQGQIQRLGVSVATPEEVVTALSFPDVELIQLPFNILDHRWEHAGIPALLRERPEVLVVSRSALLQGVLTQEPALWPSIAPELAQQVSVQLDAWVAQSHCKNRIELCLSYVRAQPWIDAVIVGMETTAQLEENIALFSRPSLSMEACIAIREQLPLLADSFLNPALWHREPTSHA